MKVMADWRESQELLMMEGRSKVPYSRSAGAVGKRYLNALQGGGKVQGDPLPRLLRSLR